MKVSRLRGILEDTMTAMPAHADRLRELDAALGDGDLGVTVSSGAAAVAGALAALDGAAAADAVILAAAKAFMNANPSTFAALAGGGLLAAARTVQGKDSLDRDDAVAVVGACIASISRRGKSQPGDKTVLDPLARSADALATADGDGAAALDAMIAAAQAAIDETTPLASAKGRAAWLQQRSAGLADPGSVAYLLLLTELKNSWAG